MFAIVVAMLLILVVCAVVALYVAFPHRGEDVPAAPWLGEALWKARESLPTIDEEQGDPTGRR